jgi:16S rRNA (cytosine1402-N4)-methyltransferase
MHLRLRPGFLAPSAVPRRCQRHHRPVGLPRQRAYACSAVVAPPHTPVLPAEILENLSIRASSRPAVFVDGTVGAGGHAALLLSAPGCGIRHYVGVDRDPTALALAEEHLRPLAARAGVRLDLLRGDFRDVDGVLRRAGLADVIGQVGGCLLDVGVSSMQLDNAERGFSFMRDGPLDMRMDGTGGDFARTAADIVNSSGVDELVAIFRDYGEERRARLMADRIVRGRPFERTLELAEALRGGESGRGRVHPATLCFQALRIAVNGELDALDNGVRACRNLLEPGEGRLGVITFHSLEDRIVKRLFRDMASETGGVRLLTKRPIVCGRKEEKANPRSRSAKLRICSALRVNEAPVIGKVNKYPRQT